MSQVDTSEKTLFVRGLDYSTTDTQLEEAFSDYGPIKTCFTVKDKGQNNIVIVMDIVNCVWCRHKRQVSWIWLCHLLYQVCV